MTGAGVHHVEHSKKFRDPSFEHIRIYVGNSSIKKHIPNTVGVIVVTPGICNSGFYKRIICSYHTNLILVAYKYVFCSTLLSARNLILYRFFLDKKLPVGRIQDFKLGTGRDANIQ